MCLLDICKKNGSIQLIIPLGRWTAQKNHLIYIEIGKQMLDNSSFLFWLEYLGKRKWLTDCDCECKSLKPIGFAYFKFAQPLLVDAQSMLISQGVCSAQSFLLH